MRAKLIVAAAAMVLRVGGLHAHHSTTPVYDSRKAVTKAGVVTSFRLVNPHAMLELEVAEEGGKVVPWIVEFDGRLNMTRFGWDHDTLKPGDWVTVTGNPTHSGSPRMFFIELQRPDGTQLRRAMIEPSVNAAEEARRKRAEQARQ
jgi:hypothetical protein